MTERPTLRQLEYLVALADLGHFGRAAEATHVTQPGLSAQIRRLEELVGQPLFERRPRGVLPTAAGAQAVLRARSVLRQVDELVECARHAGEPMAGPLHLGVIPTIAPYLLPLVLPRIRRRFPRLVPYLREDKTDALLARLESGQLDVALLALPVPDASQLVERPLFEDPFLLAAPADHPLARRKRLREEDLEGEELLLLDEGHCLRDQALAVCSAAGAHEQAGFRATSLATLVQMIASGHGVTLLPAMAAETEAPKRAGLVLVPFGGRGPRRTIGLVWRASSPRSEEYEALAHVVEEAARGG